MSGTTNGRRGWILGSWLCGALLGAVGWAGGVEIFRIHSQDGFLKGTLEGMSIDELGTLRPGPSPERLLALEEPFLLSAASHPDGWVVGTGNEGRVLLVRRDGEVEELFAAAEPEIFAVWAAADGTVYAGSSPDGKVYRHRNGEVEEYFDPQETYVWALAGGPDVLYVATGTRGKLFRVREAGRGDVLWDSDDTHVRSLAVAADGAVLAGTAGEGLVVRIGPEGAVTTLHDALAPEVVALAPGGSGEVWAAVVASEASQLPAPRKTSRSSSSSEEEGEEGEADEEDVAVTEVTEGQVLGSRTPGYKGPRSEIVRIDVSHRVDSVARLKSETVYSILWADDGLWIGTGLEGKIYRLQGDDLILQADVDERQVMALLPDEGPPAFGTTNAAAFYRFRAGEARQGTYTSPVLDAGVLSRFGTFHWLGDEPRGSALRFSFRSGMSSEPDATWAPWTSARQGNELGLDDLPQGRYVQWRAEATSRGAQVPSLAAAELSYRQENLAPEIASIEALEPGQILVSFNFNPGQQVFEPQHPDREGIFTTLRASTAEDDTRTKGLWKKGYRTLKWSATDPNEDELRYRLEFRRNDREEAWLPVADGLEELHYSFDATALPDGVYRFRLTAADRAEGDPLRRTHERVSEPVLVDHTPPTARVERTRAAGWRVVVSDLLNPLREAVYSVDAGEWRPAETEDGLLDARREVLLLDVPAEAKLVVLRLTDAALNSVTLDLAAEEP
jgi:hypothetical protein